MYVCENNIQLCPLYYYCVELSLCIYLSILIKSFFCIVCVNKHVISCSPEVLSAGGLDSGSTEGN